MNAEALYTLIVSAFAKFLAADLSVDRARFGLFGIWVVREGDTPTPDSDSQLDRTLASRAAWSKNFGDTTNPYADLAIFYQSGASLGRWENNILDIFGPQEKKLYGVPLSSLIASANKLLRDEQHIAER